MDPRIELRHLRYFVAVADALHFGRAAKQLGIAQPPLSIQVRRLEELLGVNLLDRTNRRVALTDAGRHLLAESKELLAAMGRATESTRRAARGESGTLTVAFAASVMFLSLPRIIRAFRRAFPAVHLELRELPTGPQLSALRAGDLDVGFVREPAPNDDLRFETVMRERLVIALSKRHRLSERQQVSLTKLRDQDFILFPKDLAPGLYGQVFDLCRAAGFTPRVVQESRELYTTVSLVEAGMGVTIVPASVRQMGWRGVRYFPLPAPSGLTRIDAAWRADNTSPLVRSFLDLVRGLGGRSHGGPKAKSRMIPEESS